jgi:hypothetical protein
MMRLSACSVAPAYAVLKPSPAHSIENFELAAAVVVDALKVEDDRRDVLGSADRFHPDRRPSVGGERSKPGSRTAFRR